MPRSGLRRPVARRRRPIMHQFRDDGVRRGQPHSGLLHSPTRHRFGYLVRRTAGITDNLNESHFFRQHRLDKMALPRRPALTGYF